MLRLSLLFVAIAVIVAFVHADGPKDNIVENVRPVPPPGVKIPANQHAELKKGVVELGNEIDDLRKTLAKKPALLELLPDVQIYYNAVYYALKYNEFYSEKETAVAR